MLTMVLSYAPDTLRMTDENHIIIRERHPTETLFACRP